MGDGHGTALLGLCLGNPPVSLGLIHLQLRAHIAAHIHVCDIDGQDLERGAGVQALVQHGPADQVGVLQHVLVALGGADGGDDALADAGDDGLLAGAAHQAVDVGPHGHPRLGPQLDAVLGDGSNDRGLDHLGIDGHLHGLQHIAAGQVNGLGLFKGQLDLGALGRDQRVHHPVHVAAGQVQRLQLVHRNVDAGLAGLDHRRHDAPGVHAAELHAYKVEDADVYAAHQRREPQAQREQREQCDHQENDDDRYRNGNDVAHIHDIISLPLSHEPRFGCPPRSARGWACPWRRIRRRKLRSASRRQIRRCPRAAGPCASRLRDR